MRIQTLLRKTTLFQLALLCSFSLKADLSLSKALALSGETGKNIYIEYTADWCLPCQIFEESVLIDQKVNSLIGSDFIMIKADYDNIKYAEFYTEYSIACMPTQLIIDSDGEVLIELYGTTSASAFYEAIMPFALDQNDINFSTIKSVSSIDSIEDTFKQEDSNLKNSSNKHISIPNAINEEKLSPKAYKSIASTEKIITARNTELSKKITSSTVTNATKRYDTNDNIDSTISSSRVYNAKSYYVLQVGAYSKIKNAEKQKEKIFDIMNQNVEIVFMKDSKLYTVQIGRFQSIQDLVSVKNILTQTGIDHFVKRNKV